MLFYKMKKKKELENRETNNLDTEKLSKFDWKKYFTQNENNEGKEEQKENPKKNRHSK